MPKNNNFFPYVLSELQGGIGNLIFEYAAALSISKKLNSRLVFTNLQEGSKEWLESYLGKNLNSATNTELLFMGNTSHIKNNYFKMLVRLFKKLGIRFGTTYFGTLMESLEKNVLKKSKWGINLNGYYQHPSFYEDVKNEILDMLGTNMFGEKFRNSNFEKRTLIHLRRGDYLHHPGWTLNKEFYLNALQKYDPDRLDPVCIVSNEPLAVVAFEYLCDNLGYKIIKLENIKDNIAIQKKNLSGNFITNSTRDFLAIAQSKRIIMSNCTFCWWAVSLGDYIFGKDIKETVYPKGWIKNLPDTLKQDHWFSEIQ